MAIIKTDKDRALNGLVLRTHYIPGTELGDARRVQVLLPKGYEDSKNDYPVIYMLDGQNLFYDDEAFVGHSWRVSETLNSYPDLPPMIVVGIDNSHDRINEYSPWVIEKTLYTSEYEGIGGGGKAHAKYIIENVKPFIDKNYRTKSDRQHTAMAGSSLGGSMTSYIGLEYKDAVGGLGVFSLANQLFKNGFEHIIEAKEIDPNQKIYIQVGTDEAESPEHSKEEQIAAKQDYVDCTLDYYQKLLQKGIKVENVDLHIYVGETHNEKYWAEHLSDCLRFLSQEW